MSFIQDRVYPLSPVYIQNALVSAFGFKWQRRRFGGIFNQELVRFKSRENFTYDQWRDYQTAELRKLLIHAYETVPFYNSVYKETGLTVDDFRKFELKDLDKLPALSKEDLRKYGTSTLLSYKREKNGEFFSSSGSTGTPTKILFSASMHQKWSAVFEARIRNWAGLTRLDSRGMIGGRRIVPGGVDKGPYHRYNIFEKQVYFSAYHISSATSPEYATALNKYKPAYMTGYAMSNFFLARFFDDKKITVPGLKAVVTSSEKLTPEMREMFLKVYGCKTYDSYSGVEACGLISENEYGQLLVSPDVGILEILNDDGSPCKSGETGEIYSTGFLNYDQPLIRYRIGDRVKLSPNQNTRCGRNMTVIEEIEGRVEDIVTGPDGRKLVRFHGIFIDLPNVVEGQVIQNAVDDFEIKVVCVNRLNSNERKAITFRIISQLGPVEVRINEVDCIPRNKNGKFRAVITNLPHN